MTFSARFRYVPVKNSAVWIRRTFDSNMRFFFYIRARVTAVAVVACFIEQGMFGIRPLFIITFCKLAEGSSMAFKRTGYVPCKVFNSYFFKLLLSLIKSRKFFMTV